MDGPSPPHSIPAPVAAGHSRDEGHLIPERITDGFIALDQDWRFTYLSEQAERVLRRRQELPEDIRGKNLWEVFPDLVGTRLHSAYQTALRDQVPVALEEFCPDSAHCYAIHVYPDRHGLSIYFQEVTEHERLALLHREQTARHDAVAAQQRLTFLAEVSNVLTSSLDYSTTLASVARLAVPQLADLCIVDVVEGRQIRRMASAAVDPGKEELLHLLQERYPPDWDSPQPVARALRDGASLLIAEIAAPILAATTRDAEHLRIVEALNPRSVLAVPLTARGHTVGVITLALSESGRRYGPADVTVAEDLAAHAALAVDNARLHRDVQEAVRLRDEFLSSAAHDLRAPIAVINGYAQLLRRRASRSRALDPAWLASAVAPIETTTAKMSAQIDELLDLARLQMGHPLDLRRRPTDLVALIRQVTTSYRKAMRHHRLHVHAGVPQLVGSWDPVRLERVVTNLLSNAVKYSAAGTTITVTVDSNDVAGEPWAVLIVRDEGMGIPAGDLPRIFEGFYRGQNVGKIGGIGIGLAGSQQIVEQHGGTIAVESTEGAGSAFTVRLPLLSREEGRLEADG